ncbi:unnamed protein product [Chondrus crispus]|uniref:Uncharacterized protein n=1 Tax=Chondrus crispus TaxID=2769 RepID=R7QNN7_CHOCR|nr:unnamed protein product [Chondrus crispus]CDF40117.1 unnamed protein product [Chondrus crispus]|eukprot:XP_005710411.1 unnamed protein product [Chondrus crispus]
MSTSAVIFWGQKSIECKVIIGLQGTINAINCRSGHFCNFDKGRPLFAVTEEGSGLCSFITASRSCLFFSIALCMRIDRPMVP